MKHFFVTILFIVVTSELFATSQYTDTGRTFYLRAGLRRGSLCKADQDLLNPTLSLNTVLLQIGQLAQNFLSAAKKEIIVMTESDSQVNIGSTQYTSRAQ